MEPSQTPRDTFSQILAGNRPQAAAWVRGGENAPSLSGLVKFFDTPYGGILVEAEIFGLPNISRRIPPTFMESTFTREETAPGIFPGPAATTIRIISSTLITGVIFCPFWAARAMPGELSMTNGFRCRIFWAVPWSFTETGMISPVSPPAVPGRGSAAE